MVANKTKRRKKTPMKYIIRRVIALAIICALLLAGAWGLYKIMKSKKSSSASQDNVSISQTHDPSHKNASSSSSTSESVKSSSSSSSPDGHKGVFYTKKAKDSGIPDCTSHEVTISLDADKAIVDIDGSLTFTKKIRHIAQPNCLLNTNDDSLVTIITNDQGVQVWRSDACTVEDNFVLLTDNDSYSKTTTWNTVLSNSALDNSLSSHASIGDNGHACAFKGESLPHVQAGDYTAQLIDMNDIDLKSDPVKISVVNKQEVAQTQEHTDDQQHQ